MAGVHDGDGTAVTSMRCHWSESKEPKHVYIQLDCTLAAAHSSFAARGILSLPVVTSQQSGLFRASRNRRRRWGDQISRPSR